MRKSFHAIWAALFALFLATPVLAHEIRPAVADLFLENDAYRLEIKLNLEAVIAEIGAEVDDTENSPNAEKYDDFRAMDPETLSQAFDLDDFAARFVVLLDGKEGNANVVAVDIPPVGDIALLRDSHVTVTGALMGAQSIQLGWDSAYGEIIIRLMNDESDFNAYLPVGAITDPISTGGATVLPFGQNLLNYIFVGFDHIVPKGLDHILFVVGLFLLSTRLRPLLWQVTTFTLAHTVTLALGVLGILVLPGAIVEPLIAASIVYVCVENIFLSHLSRWRPALIFVFGLLHGQGFAGALTEFGLSQNNVISGLIGFNLGVELGQIAVILACFALVGFWFAQKPWYRRVVTIPASTVIALIGAYWVVERVGLI